MYDLSFQEWEMLFKRDEESFFIRMQKYLEEQEISPIRACMEFLTTHFLYLTETKKKSELEKLLPGLRKIVESILFIANKKPALYVIKGRMETLLEMGEFIHNTTPDVEWFTQLNGKYQEQILRYLYQKSSDQMSRIAESIRIHPSQLTPIIEQLEQNEFVERKREGKNVWCFLTKKGFLLGKYFYNLHSIGSTTTVLKEITRLMKQGAKPQEWEKVTHKYEDQYPELIVEIKKIQEMWSERIFYVVAPTPTNWDNVVSMREEIFLRSKLLSPQKQPQQKTIQI